ncbi:MAG: ABC transporter substrate-binding protein [Candidatus Moduliflexus flocculans]|nr:ABC transporter substrate-binding protein [Candidatus Moduliflexus flocculans]
MSRKAVTTLAVVARRLSRWPDAAAEPGPEPGSPRATRVRSWTRSSSTSAWTSPSRPRIPSKARPTSSPTAWTPASSSACPSRTGRKLSVYPVPSGSWSYLMNPIPNQAPYVWKTAAGKEYFNPLAIREVRYAINWLIDRKKMVDEILLGGGEPAFTSMTPGQPGTYRYNIIATKLGMTERGDEKRAIAEITAALEGRGQAARERGQAQASPAQFWTYKGQPIVVKFIIRVDDPQGRLPAGRYVADQLEKAGIKVERLEYDRSKAGKMVYGGDPAAYEWTMYTEGWGAGATRRWWDVSISQMYAPYYGYMPGGATEGFWNYKQDEIDKLAQKSYNGWFLTSEEYWTDNLKAQELGLTEARPDLGLLPDGLLHRQQGPGHQPLRLRPGGRPERLVLHHRGREAQRQGREDPAGHPVLRQGRPVHERLGPRGRGRLLGHLRQHDRGPVHHAGVLRGAEQRHRHPLHGQVGPQGRAVQRGPGHHRGRQARGPHRRARGRGQVRLRHQDLEEGRPGGQVLLQRQVHPQWIRSGTTANKIGVADFVYALGFTTDWSTKDGDADLAYEEAYASQYQPTLETLKGVIFNKDGSFTTYYDFNWPMDKNRVAYGGLLSPKAGNPGRPTMVPWMITEAIGLLVTEGAASGAVYAITEDPSMTQIDVASPACVADIKAKLNQMVEKKYVPVYVKDYLKPNEAVDAYKKALAFIEKYGHAYISNGPFFISKIDTTANYMELSAYRKGYPYKKDYWPKFFATRGDPDRQREHPGQRPAQRGRRDRPDGLPVHLPQRPDQARRQGRQGPGDPDLRRRREGLRGQVREGRILPGRDPRRGPRTSSSPAATPWSSESKFADEAPSVKPATLVLF